MGRHFLKSLDCIIVSITNAANVYSLFSFIPFGGIVLDRLFTISSVKVSRCIKVAVRSFL